MPDELYSLTLAELQSLQLHQARRDRHDKYVAYYNAWLPNHRDGDEPVKEAEFMPLPGDPGWMPPQKEVTVEECKEMMARNGEGEA